MNNQLNLLKLKVFSVLMHLCFQVQICVLSPYRVCVPVILCASTLRAPTPVCADRATTM